MYQNKIAKIITFYYKQCYLKIAIKESGIDHFIFKKKQVITY